MARATPPNWVIGVESRLLDRIRAAVMVTSLDGTVLYANPYCEVLYGRSPAELEGKASADFSAEPLSESTVGDIGVIDVADGLTIRRVAAVHADPSRQDLVELLHREFGPTATGPHPAASVVRGGKSQFSPEMSEEFLREMTRDEKHYEVVRALGFTSYMCVPLAARGRMLGALTLVSAGSGRHFSED